MTAAVPETAISTPNTAAKGAVEIKNKVGTELNATGSAAAASTKIQAAMIMAMQRPRDQKKALSELLDVCKDEDFAEDAIYTFPRGDATVEGLSVNIAREMARVWGNLHYGVDIVGEDETTRQIRGWAWDLETGAQAGLDDAFAKMVYRRNKGWIKADERELRELNNRRAAILERNCILKLIPPMVKKQAEKTVKETLRRAAAAAPEKAIQKMIEAFSEIGIAATELEKYLKHPVSQTTPEEIAKMKGVYKSIIDGNSRWDEYVEQKAQEATPSKATIDIGAIKAGAEENRGHGQEGLEGLAQPVAESRTTPEPTPTPVEQADRDYEPPVKPKQALMDYLLAAHAGNREGAKADLTRMAMDFFNREIKTVNDLSTEEALALHRSVVTGKYHL